VGDVAKMLQAPVTNCLAILSL